MTIVVGFSSRAEGHAALDWAAAEAALRQCSLVVVPNADADEQLALQHELPTSVPVRVEAPGREGQMAERILDVAADLAAELVVIGVKRRTPTGKLLLGVHAQKVMLDAGCPVVVVRAPGQA
ncbi:universal stress protein [Granulicoccus phenolivorans]|uniref:universal stress protein n=1 Tax=Granulicoccus phenolivorans TaxID=266854 RepID=UPI0003F766A0|nr:universal stress protein [Granulicoccus phenolivorans]